MYLTIKYYNELKRGEKTTNVRPHDSNINRGHNNHPLDLMDINHKIKLREWATPKMYSIYALVNGEIPLSKHLKFALHLTNNLCKGGDGYECALPYNFVVIRLH